MGLRSAADEIRRGVTDSIRDGFNHERVQGLAISPSITQNPTRFTAEPYIYIYSVGENEIDRDSDDASVEYSVNVEVCLRYRSYNGGQRQANRIVDEILSVIRQFGADAYPDLSNVGYNIYRITSGNIVHTTFKDRGANYYKVICPLFVRAQFIGLPQDNVPVQDGIYTYSGFTHQPTANRNIEQYDSGVITGALTYPSNNNGWDFVSVSYAPVQSSQGTLVNNVYTVGNNDDPLGLVATLDYEFETDNSITTTIVDTDNFNRIRSLRFGSILPQTGNVPVLSNDTADTYGVQNLSNWDIDFGTVNPTNEAITINQVAGEHLYIIQDNTAPHITDIRPTSFATNPSANFIDQFTITTVGAYRVYIRTNVAAFSGNNNITLMTG